MGMKLEEYILSEAEFCSGNVLGRRATTGILKGLSEGRDFEGAQLR